MLLNYSEVSSFLQVYKLVQQENETSILQHRPNKLQSNLPKGPIQNVTLGWLPTRGACLQQLRQEWIKILHHQHIVTAEAHVLNPLFM